MSKLRRSANLSLEQCAGVKLWRAKVRERAWLPHLSFHIANEAPISLSHQILGAFDPARVVDPDFDPARCCKRAQRLFDKCCPNLWAEQRTIELGSRFSHAPLLLCGWQASCNTSLQERPADHQQPVLIACCAWCGGAGCGWNLLFLVSTECSHTFGEGS
eukprot:2564115-Amphidinium_carterae.1